MEPPPRHSDEGERERFDRELLELLNELRVALPGVQILFAFLLTFPFSPGFPRATQVDRVVYFLTLLFAAAASALLIAPSMYHRLHWRREIADKDQMLATSNRFAIAGGGFLALAMSGAIFVITNFLFGMTGAALATAGATCMFAGLWYVLPLSRRRHAPRKPPLN